MDFSEIAKSRPADSTARRVVSRGQHYDPSSARMGIRTQPPLSTAFPLHSLNLTGERFGSVVVVGYAAIQPRQKSKWFPRAPRWVVRCDCGLYEMHKEKTLRAMGKKMKCRYCERMEWMRSGGGR